MRRLWTALVVVAGCSVDPTQLVVVVFAGAGEVAPRDGNTGVFIHSFVPGP